MKVLSKFRFHPPIQPNAKTNYCNVYIFPNSAGDGRSVVVLAEPQGYEGMSITNGAEHIITKLINCGHTTHDDIYVEHYPVGAFGGDSEESFDMIRHHTQPIHWTPFSRTELETLIGQPFKGQA